jgi:two-component system sensor histidine kinase/response regulator
MGVKIFDAFRGPFVVLLTALALLVPLVGVSFVYLQTPQIEAEAYRSLQAVARLKTQQIESWLDERQGDTLFLRAALGLNQQMRQVLNGTATAQTRREVISRFQSVMDSYHYSGVMLMNRDANIVLSQGLVHDDAAEMRTLVRESIRLNHVLRSELEGGEREQAHLNWVIPLGPTGVLVLHASVSQFLYPLIETWPSASPSAETMLVGQEDDSVLFLNTLRHLPQTTAGLRVPMDKPRLPAAVALRSGQVGTVAGLDYRSAEVLTAYHPIANTTWSIVAKVDRDEVMAPMWDTFAWLVAVSLAALAAITIAMVLLWRAQKGAADRLVGTLMDNSSDAIFIKDLAGHYLLVNRECARVLGRTMAQVLGQTDAVLFPAQATLIQDDDQRVVREGKVKTYEETVTTVDGVRTYLATKGPMRDGDGRVTGVFGVSRDITERKMAEAKLVRTSKLYAALGLTSEAIARSTTQEELFPQICRDAVTFGGMAMAWIGLVDPRTQTVIPVASFGEGQDYLQDITISTQADSPFGRGPTATALRDAQPQWCQDFMNDPRTVAWHARGARSGWGASAAIPLYRAGVAVGALTLYARERNGFDEDIQKLLVDMGMDVSFALDNFERSALLRQLSQAVHQSTESIVITNLKAEIEYVNDAFLQATGYTRDEVVGQNPRVLHSGNTPAQTYVSLWQAMAQGKSWKGEFYNRRKDGSEYVEFAIVSPLRQPDGSISHYVAVKEDVTDKKRIGEELDAHRHRLEELVEQRTLELTRARHEADAANHAKSAFLANMSHEIRTPMNAIMGLNHLLRRAGTTPEQTERLDKIDHASRHLLSIINDVLDISKIESGKLRLENTDFCIADIVNNVRALVEESARAKGIAMHVEGDALPLWVRGDPTRMRQALLNYAGNAVKFTDQGSITLRALLADHSNPLLVRFEVVDTGIGLTTEGSSNLFHAFVQADTSTTRKHGGTGLGLSITQRLAELMGGTAGVDSVLGLGSTFWFTARLQAGAPVSLLVPTPSLVDAETGLRQRHSGARILLADDNAVNREVAQELLRAAGLVVDTASSGTQAIAMARQHTYALVLMDVRMPEMDGLQATRALREIPHLRALPIIALTANAFAEDRQACQDAGMNDFIAKPMEPALLYATVLKWLPSSATTPSTPEAGLPFDPLAAVVTPGPVAPPLSTAELRQVLTQLGALLAQNDTAASALFAQHANALTAALGESAAVLSQQIKAFAFEAAQATLIKCQISL